MAAMQTQNSRWTHFETHQSTAHLRAELAERVLNVDIKPLTGAPFRAAIDLVDLGPLSVVSFDMSGCVMARTGRHLADGYEGLALSVATETELVASQSGQEFVVRPGEAILMDARWASDLAAREATVFLGFRISRQWFNRFSLGLPNSARLLAANPALEMLTAYALRVTAIGGGVANTVFAPMFESHISELLAAAVIAGGAAAPSDEAALTDIRYRCISQELRIRASSPDLTLRSFSAAIGMPERSIQSTLTRHGTSFSDLLRNYRLAMALDALRRGKGSVTSIAFATGFQDISTFNRAFRTAFGMRPSDVTPLPSKN
jgi:AraC-like DNA-binding protein